MSHNISQISSHASSASSWGTCSSSSSSRDEAAGDGSLLWLLLLLLSSGAAVLVLRYKDASFLIPLPTIFVQSPIIKKSKLISTYK